MNVASNSISSKRCVICGIDVSQSKRTKDTSGRYYCEPCYLSRSSGGNAAPGASPASPAAGRKRRMYLAAGVAFVLVAGIATVAYVSMAGPSRRTVVVPEASAPRRAPRSATAPQPTPSAIAKVNSRNSHGRTALNLAAAGGHQGEAESLLARGADVNAKDSDGATPLHAAARRGHRGVVEFLLSKGATIGAQDNHGETPLHLAAAHGNQGVAEFLLSKGADINAKDNAGRTPVAIATQRRQTNIAQFLRQHGGAE